LNAMGFETPTPIQAAAIPPAMEGKDVLGIAQTGTGKTGAFGIPLLTALHADPAKRALILSPTRELAAQIHLVLKTMGEGVGIKGILVLGGESFRRQKQEFLERPNYVVATPGRLIDHVGQGLKLSRVSLLVLDEVDRILDMGFYPQLVEILQHIPKERQTLMFSATMPTSIRRLADKHQRDPVKVTMGQVDVPIEQIVQETIETPELRKTELLFKHLAEREGKILVFANTKSRTDWVANVLEKRNFDIVRLHGDCTPSERKRALEAFRTGAKRIMIATDLAGRGIDVDDIEYVINYDMPLSREDYIHRIGRTGRNGRTGHAINYLCPTDFEGYRIVYGEKTPTKPNNRRL
jgi:ATP-dependent RNA helicase DeaD